MLNSPVKLYCMCWVCTIVKAHMHRSVHGQAWHLSCLILFAQMFFKHILTSLLGTASSYQVTVITAPTINQSYIYITQMSVSSVKWGNEYIPYDQFQYRMSKHLCRSYREMRVWEEVSYKDILLEVQSDNVFWSFAVDLSYHCEAHIKC